MNRILLVFFISTSFFAKAGEVIIRGSAVSYAGNTILVYSEDDYISRQKKHLAQSEIGPNGDFEILLELETVRQLRLTISSVEALVYAEPDKIYEIEIPSFEAMPGAKTFNRIEVMVTYLNLEESDLVMLIRAFDERYNEFVNEHYNSFAIENFRGSDTYKVHHQEQLGIISTMGAAQKPDKTQNSSKSKTNQPESGATLVSDFSAGIYDDFEEFLDQEFLYNHIRYSLAQLEMAAGYKKEELYNEYFMSKPFLHHHPAYMQFFSMMFESSFNDALNGNDRDEILQAVNGFREFPALNRAFEDNPMLTVEHVRHMTILLGLRNAFHQNTLHRTAIVELLGKTFSTLRDPKVAQTARNLQLALTKNKQGWHLDNFTVVNQQRKQFSLDSLSGKYVYFFFYADWCTACLKEIQIMEKLHAQYKNYIEFVCVSMDENQIAFAQGLAAMKNKPWTFVFGPSDPLLREKFGLKSLPHACLIDPQGNYMMDYTRKPSEGVANQFEEIKLKFESKGQGQKTWKD